MAAIYNAELDPGKLEVLVAWLRTQDWSADIDLDATPLEKVAAYRFDDPAGEVGIEVHIVRAGDRVLQIPLTYRGAPLDTPEGTESETGSDSGLVSEMAHSILGRRWVYQGTHDPVFLSELRRTIIEADTSARQFMVDDSGHQLREITEVARAWGTGTGSAAGVVAGADTVNVTMLHDLNLNEMWAAEGSDGLSVEEPGLLLGTWPGQENPVVLARLK